MTDKQSRPAGNRTAGNGTTRAKASLDGEYSTIARGDTTAILAAFLAKARRLSTKAHTARQLATYLDSVLARRGRP